MLFLLDWYKMNISQKHIWNILSFHGCWAIVHQAKVFMTVHRLPHGAVQRCQGISAKNLSAPSETNSKSSENWQFSSCAIFVCSCLFRNEVAVCASFLFVLACGLKRSRKVLRYLLFLTGTSLIYMIYYFYILYSICLFFSSCRFEYRYV